jgi:hypothetical protein
MAKVKYATQAYYDLWSKAMSDDKIMNEANMTEKWAYIFTDKPTDTGPMTWIATWDHGKVSVKPGNAEEPVDFKFKADYITWAGVIQGTINAQKASVTGKYKIEGPFSKMMKNVKALGHMADLAKALPDVEY